MFLKTDHLFCIEQRFASIGSTPDYCLDEWALESGLKAIVLAVGHRKVLHTHMQFQGDIRSLTIILVMHH